MSFLWYFYHLDTSAYDEAVDKVKKYKKLLEDVTKYVDSASETETIIVDFMQNVDSTIAKNDAGSAGHVLNFYEGKVAQWKEYRPSYWNRMKDELSEAKKRQETIRQLISDWENTRDSEARALDEEVEELQS